MPTLTFENNDYQRELQESVLDCLTRHGVNVPHSCKSGVCQSCTMRALKTDPPAAAQRGLKDSLKQQRYFLACACTPEGDFAATLSGPELIRVPARVVSVDKLSRRIARVRLDHNGAFEYRAGQFINLWRGDGLTRSYSIASLPHTEHYLELHVARLEQGRMSNWIHDELRPGDVLAVSAPHGECCYRPEHPHQPLLLIGTGCGLAPLYGIVRDALHHGHPGPIWLYHGSREREGLYLVDELRRLAHDHDNLHYVPCLTSAAADGEDYLPQRAHEAALARHADLKDWRVFLCGHPDMVKQTRMKAYLAGAALADIHADPFHIAAP
jgi:NAD(P)H-flavin reductase